MLLPLALLAVVAAALILVHDAKPSERGPSADKAAQAPASLRPAPKFMWAHVTAYSTRESLTGCKGYAASGERICGTACGHPWGLLHDWQFTVASNPRFGLACGTRLRFCLPRAGGGLCHNAIVTDRTASFFDFEFSRALAYATGAPHADFGTPRWVLWRRP